MEDHWVVEEVLGFLVHDEDFHVYVLDDDVRSLH